VDGLEALTIPFEKQEMDDVIKAMPSDRASYVSNVSIIFDAPCLFLHHLPNVSLHFVALLCIFRN
jgi:hypothetical protein